MLTKSLRTEIAIFTVLAICVVSSLVLWFSIKEYETLYQQAASDDLNGLSENLASDLMPYMSEQDSFAITNILLRLDQYENNLFAVVFNNNHQVIEYYLGKSTTKDKTPEQVMALPQISADNVAGFKFGMSVHNGQIIAKKRVGEEQLPLGYMVISHDLSSYLTESRKNLFLSVLPWVIMTITLALIVILVFQHKALQPLIQLANFTKVVSDTKNYRLEAEVKGKQEISELTLGLNSMMKVINSEIEKNKAKNDLLMSQQSQMERLANFDGLTQLPNRQSFMRKLSVALAQAKDLGNDLLVIFMDLDGFKLVNDSFGHEIGDKLLCEIADAIQCELGPHHLVARLGGDEFLLLINEDADNALAEEIVKRIIGRIKKPFTIDYWQVQVGTSVGIASAREANYVLSDLIANADVAMYKAKDSERNSYRFFTQDMIDDSRRRLEIANSIESALNNNELTLNYQAKVNSLGKTVGYEALARWFSEDLGQISPAEFIPIAEQSGKISIITEWVIEQVCEDVKHLIALNGEVVVSLNLSIHDLMRENFAESVEKIISRHQVSPRNLEFEITESVYLQNFGLANQFIEKIRALGCFVALDDFGTGYSSLSYLTEIKIDTLKIDKQFVDKIGISTRSEMITKTIISMGQQLKLSVCAEGIESQAQADMLIENGCHQLQGYLFAKPVPLASLCKAKQTA